MSLMALFGPMLLRYGGHVAAVVAILVTYGAWGRAKIEKGVEKERVRVEIQGNKTDAKARSARRAAEQRPAGVLERYYRD